MSNPKRKINKTTNQQTHVSINRVSSQHLSEARIASVRLRQSARRGISKNGLIAPEVGAENLYPEKVRTAVLFSGNPDYLYRKYRYLT